MSSYGALKRSGWHLSEEGVEKCIQAFKEQEGGREPDVKGLERCALNCDLRAVGAGILPSSLSGKIQGPLVLQIQKIRNVAVPSTKQHSSSSKRILRVYLTDGHSHCSGVEMEGPIDGLSSLTQPGTKVKIKASTTVSVQNGFLMLTRNCLEVLGGSVEHMLKKWNIQKISSLNLERSRTGVGGPPPYVPYSKANSLRASSISTGGGRPSSTSQTAPVSQARKSTGNQRSDARTQARSADASKQGHHQVAGPHQDTDKTKLEQATSRHYFHKGKTDLATRGRPNSDGKNAEQHENSDSGSERHGSRNRYKRDRSDDYVQQGARSTHQLSDWFTVLQPHPPADQHQPWQQTASHSAFEVAEKSFPPRDSSEKELSDRKEATQKKTHTREEKYSENKQRNEESTYKESREQQNNDFRRQGKYKEERGGASRREEKFQDKARYQHHEQRHSATRPRKVEQPIRESSKDTVKSRTACEGGLDSHHPREYRSDTRPASGKKENDPAREEMKEKKLPSKFKEAAPQKTGSSKERVHLTAIDSTKQLEQQASATDVAYSWDWVGNRSVPSTASKQLPSK